MGERGGTGRKEEKEEKGESVMSVVRAPEKLHTERRSKLKRATTTAGRSQAGQMHKVHPDAPLREQSHTFQYRR